MMRFLLHCLTALLLAASADAQQIASASMEERAPYALPEDDYDAFVRAAQENFPGPFDEAGFRRDHPSEDWRLLRRGAQLEAHTFAYRVGGLRITGAIVRPLRGGRRPILIWARGGVGAARLDPPQMVEMAWWARQGYVVIASNYRGAAGGEGRDEFAGADVDDLRALADLAVGLEDVDPNRMFAIGFSRGGLMLFRAVAEGMPVRAFATAGAPTDLAAIAAGRPDLEELFARMMPDYEAERANNYCRRSPVCWSERIDAPVLIAHGGADRAVAPEQAWAIARRLTETDRDYRLIVYGGADHGLSGSRRAFFETAHAYFEAH